MKTRLQLGLLVLGTAAALSIVSPGSAKDRPAYEKGKLLSMESVPCGYNEDSGQSLTGELLGNDSTKKKTRETLCPEYVLQGQHVIYHIRPKEDKHPVLLPIGEMAEFRVSKDKMLLRVPEGDDKEREYSVVSMMARDDSSDHPVASSHSN